MRLRLVLSVRPPPDIPGRPGSLAYLTVFLLETREGRIAREIAYWSKPLPAPEWRAPWIDADATRSTGGSWAARPPGFTLKARWPAWCEYPRQPTAPLHHTSVPFPSPKRTAAFPSRTPSS